MIDGLAETYPMMRGGGLMLIAIGVGFLIGWLTPRYWYIPAIIGAVIGVTATAFAGLLPPPLQEPTLLQAGALIASIIVETGLLIYVIRKYGDDQNRLILAVLIAVGLHFFVMLPTFGVVIGILAALTVLNGWLAWRFGERYPRLVACLTDSALKIGVGGWMVWATTQF